MHKAALVDNTCCSSVVGHRGALDLGCRAGEMPTMCFMSAAMNFINLVCAVGCYRLSPAEAALFIYTGSTVFKMLQTQGLWLTQGQHTA